MTSTPGSVVQYRDAKVRAYAAETGEERWATDLPAGCEARTRSDTSLGGLVLLPVSCRDHAQGVLALDGRTGAIRWGPTGDRVCCVIPLDEGRVALAGTDAAAAIHSTDRGRRLGTATPPDDGTFVTGEGDVLVSWDGQATPALAAWDVGERRITWTVNSDGTWHLAQPPYVRDGLVFTVRFPEGDVRTRTLVVQDAATGEEHSRTDISLEDDADAPDYAYDDLDVVITWVADGTVTLTITEPGLPGIVQGSDFCDPCSLVLGQP